MHTCNADSAKTSTTVHAVSEQMEISHNTTVRSHLARPLKFMLIERQIQKSGNSIRNRPIGIHRERWGRGGREEGAGGGDRETERERLTDYTRASGTLQVQFQTTAIRRISQQSRSHKFFGFPVHIKVM